MAFGTPEYLYMAVQMAMSVKANNKDLPIQLVHDDSINYLHPSYYDLFIERTPIKKEHVYPNGQFEPGFAKLNAYTYSIFEQTIFLDVDGICLKDLAPVFDLCNLFYHTEVIGTGTKNDVIEYAHWASNKVIWSQFELDDNQPFYAVQSSFQYFKKSKEMDELHQLFVREFDFPKVLLSNTWGDCIPDELILGGCCAQVNHNPSLDKRITFFGNKGNRKSITDVLENFYISSLYGNGNGTKLVMERYVDMYDRLIFKYARQLNKTVIRRASRLMKHKHVG